MNKKTPGRLRPEKKPPAAKNGFTLIETIVSLAVFLLFLGAILQIFISAASLQRRALASQELLDQAGYAVEYMGRALRMARKDIAGDCIPAKTNYQLVDYSGGRGVRFLNYSGKCQEFTRFQHAGFGMMHEKKSTDSSAANLASAKALTSSKIDVASFNIGPQDSWDQEDGDQPRVTLYLDVRKRGEKPEARPQITIQTTISQRNLDVKR